MPNKKPKSLSADEYIDYLKKVDEPVSRFLEGEEKEKIYTLLKLKGSSTGTPIKQHPNQRSFLHIYKHDNKTYYVQENFDGTVTIEVIKNIN